MQLSRSLLQLPLVALVALAFASNSGTNAQGLPEDTCPFEYELIPGSCGGVYAIIYEAFQYSEPDCGGCSGSVNGFVTDSPTPIIPPIPGTVRTFTGGGSGPCDSNISQADLDCPLGGVIATIRARCGVCE